MLKSKWQIFLGSKKVTEVMCIWKRQDCSREWIPFGQLIKEKSKSAKISCCSAVRVQGVRGRLRTGLRWVNSSSKLLTSCGALMTGRKGGFTFLARRAFQSIPCKRTNQCTRQTCFWFRMHWHHLKQQILMLTVRKYNSVKIDRSHTSDLLSFSIRRHSNCYRNLLLEWYFNYFNLISDNSIF